MYAYLNNLQSVTLPHLTTLVSIAPSLTHHPPPSLISSALPPRSAAQAPEQTSMETLTESFVASLQAEFPSTVSTVFRSVQGTATLFQRFFHAHLC